MEESVLFKIKQR